MSKKTYWVLPVIALVGIALVVSGCTKKISEKSLEKSLGAATNTKVDVDVDKSQVTINSNAGSYQAGEKVTLPSGFPSDVYVIDGTIKAAITSKANESYTVSLETSKSVADAKTAYEQKIKDNGWTITTNMSYGGVATIMAEKGNRTLGVGISEIDGKTTVNLNTAAKDTSTPDAPSGN